MSEQNVSPVSGAGGGFTLEGRTVDAGRSVEWLKRGWEAFLKNPGVWIAVTVIAGIIVIVLSVVPWVGHLAANFLGLMFVGGLLLGCKSLGEGGELRVDHLLAGFSTKSNGMVTLAVLVAIAVAAITWVPLVLLGGGATASAMMMGNLAGLDVLFGGIFLAFLVSLALLVPVAMAVWFAPALVVFRNVAPLDAMKASFNVCLKNLVLFLVYGVIIFVLAFVAAIPFGLGFLVLMPVLIGAQYASYVDLYE